MPEENGQKRVPVTQEKLLHIVTVLKFLGGCRVMAAAVCPAPALLQKLERDCQEVMADFYEAAAELGFKAPMELVFDEQGNPCIRLLPEDPRRTVLHNRIAGLVEPDQA